MINASKRELGETITGWHTQNMRVGGLQFETKMDLKVGDKLDVNLLLSPSTQVNVVGWVVRSTPGRSNGQPVYSTVFKFLNCTKSISLN